MFLNKLFKPKTKKVVTTAKFFVYSDSADLKSDIIPGEITDYVAKITEEHGFSITFMDVDSIGLISKNPVTGDKIRYHGRYAKVHGLMHTFEIKRKYILKAKDIKTVGENALSRSYNDEVFSLLDKINNKFNLDRSKVLFETSMCECTTKFND